MKCIKCGCSPMEKMLYRTNPEGQLDGGWMCMDCMEKYEKELANNTKSDDVFRVLKDIEDIAHGK